MCSREQCSIKKFTMVRSATSIHPQTGKKEEWQAKQMTKRAEREITYKIVSEKAKMKAGESQLTITDHGTDMVGTSHINEPIQGLPT